MIADGVRTGQEVEGWGTDFSSTCLGFRKRRQKGVSLFFTSLLLFISCLDA